MDNSFSTPSSPPPSEPLNFDISNDLNEQKPSKKRLLETVDQLRKENQELKSQFNEAVSISETVEEIHKKNTNLVSELRQTKCEKEDLQRRLNISMQTINELNDKYEKLKKLHSSQFTNEQENVFKEIKKVKDEEKAKLEKLESELGKTKTELEENSVTIQLFKSKIERAIQNGERYFHTKIPDFDSLITLLNKPTFPPTMTEENVQQPLPENSPKSNRQLKNTIKKYKMKMKNLEDEKEQEIEALKKDLFELKNLSSKQKSYYEAQIHQLKESNQLIQEQSNTAIQNLERKIEDIKKEKTSFIAGDSFFNDTFTFQNQQQKEQLEQQQKQLELQQQQHQQQQTEFQIQQKKQQQILAAKNKEVEDQYISKINELQSKLQNAEKLRDEYNHQSETKEQEKQKLELDFERVKGELSSLQIIYNECQNEIKSLRTALHSSSSPQALSPISAEKEHASNATSRMMKLIDSQKVEIKRLTEQKEKENFEKNQLQKKLKELENELADAEKKYQRTQESFDEYCLEMQRQPKPSAEDFVPSSAFLCAELFGENKALANSIERIALNSSLQPVSKIRNSFKAIVNYYDNQLESIRSLMKEMNDNNEKVKHSFNKFLIDSSLILNEEPLTLEEFLKTEGILNQNINSGASFIQKLTQMKSRNSFLEHRYSYCRELLNRIKENLTNELNTTTNNNNNNNNKRLMFNNFNDKENQDNNYDFIEGDDILERIDGFRLALVEQAKHLKQRNKQLKQVLKSYSMVKKENEKITKEMSLQLEETQASLDNSVDKIEMQDNLIQKMKKEAMQNSQDIENLRSEKVQMETELKKMNENALAVLSNKMSEKEETLKKELSQINKKLNETEAEKNETQRQLDVCKKMLQSEKLNVRKLEDELSKIRNEMNDKEVKSQQRLKDEKKQMKESFERTFDQLRQQCETYRNDVQKMAKSISDSEEMLKKAKIQVSSLQSERNHLYEVLKSNEEANNRQKKLFETSLKAKLMAQDTEYNRKLEDLQGENELNLRKIFSFVADSFRAYFNPCIQIDEKSFRIVIEKVRREMERLNEVDTSIRRLLGASDHQSTEDAVAQMLFERSHQSI